MCVCVCCSCACPSSRSCSPSYTSPAQARQRLGSYQSLGEPFESLVEEWGRLAGALDVVRDQLVKFEALDQELATREQLAAEDSRADVDQDY